MLLRAITFALLAAPLAIAPVLAQPPDLAVPMFRPAPRKPASPTWTRLSPAPQATIRGVRVRIVEAAWCRAEQLALEDNHNPYLSPRRFGLAARIEVMAPLKPNTSAREFVRAVALEGSGGTLDSALESGADLGASVNGAVAFWDGADPRWKRGTMSLTWRDPAASEEAEGKFERTVEFQAPLPTRPDVPLQVERKWTSPHGTVYTLRKVLVRTQPQTVVQYDKSEFTYPAALYIVMQRQSPPRTPGSDAMAMLDEQQPQIFAVDAQGNETRLQGATDSSSWLLQDVLANTDKPGWDSGNRSHFTNAPLPPDARSLRIRFLAREESPAWRDESALSQFRLGLDFSKLPFPVVDAAWKPVASARGKYLQVALDDWRELEYYDKARRRLRAVFWTRDIQNPNDARRRWLLREDTLSARIGTANRPLVMLRAGQIFKARSERGFEWPFFSGLANWRPSGAALGGSEVLRPFTFTTEIETPKAEAAPFAAGMSLAGTWDEWLVLEHDWSLAGLPIPRPGQVLEINRVLEHDGARVVLRKLAAFGPGHGIAGMDPKMTEIFVNPSGLVAVFETVASALPGAQLTPLSDTISHTLQEMRDEHGRKLGSSMTSRGDDTLPQPPKDTQNKAQPDAREQWTTFFDPPAPEAKKLSLRLLLTESKKTGCSEDLSLDNLPAPEPIAPRQR